MKVLPRIVTFYFTRHVMCNRLNIVNVLCCREKENQIVYLLFSSYYNVTRAFENLASFFRIFLSLFLLQADDGTPFAEFVTYSSHLFHIHHVIICFHMHKRFINFFLRSTNTRHVLWEINRDVSNRISIRQTHLCFTYCYYIVNIVL